jgi:hypothetical protein
MIGQCRTRRQAYPSPARAAFGLLAAAAILALWVPAARAGQSWQGQQTASAAVGGANGGTYGLPGGGEALVSYNPGTYTSSLTIRSVGGALSTPVSLGINAWAAPSFDAAGNAIFVGTHPGNSYLAVSYWNAATGVVTEQDAPVTGSNEPESPSVVEHADGSAWLTWSGEVYDGPGNPELLEVFGVFRPAGQAEFDLTNGIHELYNFGPQSDAPSGMFATYAANGSSHLVIGFGGIVDIPSTGTSAATGPSFVGSSPQTISTTAAQIASYSTAPDGTTAFLYQEDNGPCATQYAASLQANGTTFSTVNIGNSSLVARWPEEIAVDATNDHIILEFMSGSGSDCISDPPVLLYSETATPTQPLGPANVVATNAFNAAASANGGTDVLVYSQCNDATQCYSVVGNLTPNIQYNTYGVVNGAQTLLSTDTSASQNADFVVADGLGDALATWTYEPDISSPSATLESNAYEPASNSVTITPAPTTTTTPTPSLITPTAPAPAPTTPAPQAIVAPVPPVAPTPTQITNDFGSLLDPTGQDATVSAISTTGELNVNVTNPEAGTFVATWGAITGSGAATNKAAFGRRTAKKKPKMKTTIVAKAKVTATKAGKVVVKLRLTSAGRKLFKAARAKHQELRLTSTLTFTPKGAKHGVTVTKKFTLKR